jgi:8-oxo-dGTP pyrophosphatase MutT (NUDIX family)
MRWSALQAAVRRDVPRRPFVIEGRHVGSVALVHEPALASWPQWLARRDDGWHLNAAAHERSAALAQVNAALRAQGRILAWRDETYAIVDAPGGLPLALIERASARFWGTLTFGAHCNGYLAGADGRPTHLWIARRAALKATDPGRLDNLVGGGVPHGQTPYETLLREGDEEAGLDVATMRRAVPGGVIALHCDIAEGLMHEHLHAFDLRLAPEVVPCNRDGEVAELHCLPVAEAIERAAAGEMTLDATLVTLDFALRHRLLSVQELNTLRPRLAALKPPAHEAATG